MPQDRPNILFFFPDQHRHDWLGTNPDVPVRTPNVDRLAERGVEFTNAVCPSPHCAPSRACLAQGVEYDRCGVPHNQYDLPTDAPTVYRTLRDDAGYHTMTCGKLDLDKGTETWGRHGKHRDPEGRKARREEIADLPDGLLDALGFSDGIDNGGPGAAHGQDPESPVGPYMYWLKERGLAEQFVRDLDWRKEDRGGPFGGKYAPTFPAPLPEDAYLDNWIARQGLDLLADTPGDRPWFLQVNFGGPHEPMDVTERMHALYRDPPVEFPPPTDSEGDLTPAEHQSVRRNYAAMIENIDRWVGRYLDELEERGELETTLVVYASDHGESLGDHGEWAKFSPYQPSVGVPLVAAGPGVAGDRRHGGPVSLIDLHATFLETAGLEPCDTDSRSLWPVLRGDTETHREVVYSGEGPWRMAFDGRYKLVEGYDRARRGREQVKGYMHSGDSPDLHALREEQPTLLFDLTCDETENVAAGHPSVVERLRDALDPVYADAEG